MFKMDIISIQLNDKLGNTEYTQSETAISAVRCIIS